MKLDFTPAEKKVLYGLVKYPDLNDRQLSEKIDVKPSTTTAIRRRLRSKDVFCTKRVPMANRLGYELLVVACGMMESSMKDEDRDTIFRKIKEHPVFFYSMGSSDCALCVGYFKNYSEYRKIADDAWQDSELSRLIELHNWMSTIFSFSSAKLVNFFDHESVLRHAFGIGKAPKVKRAYEGVSEARLTKKEKTVLEGLVAYPESSDKSIADKIQASRQAVSSMKKRFKEQGILKTIRMVNLEKIGYQMIAMGRTVFRPSAPLKSRWSGVDMTVKNIPQIFNISSNPVTFAAMAIEDYSQYHSKRRQAVGHYSDLEFLREEPKAILAPLSEIVTITDFDFSGFFERYSKQNS